MRTLLILLDKEFRQFVRNPILPRIALIFPIIVMLVTPWVTTMDVRHVAVSVVDNDRSSLSGRLLQKIGASDYFSLHGLASDFSAALRQMEQGKADIILEIPEGFERSLLEGRPEKISITANGVSALKGGLGAQYTVQAVAQTLREFAREHGAEPAPDAIVVENRFNPTLDYRHFMIPALMIMLLILLCGYLPALNIVSEKETGTIEQINVTPVSRFIFTLAKLIPYWIIGVVVLALAMLLAWSIYGLVPDGAVGAIFLAAALFILTMSGIGVTLANGSSNMQQVMFVMLFIIMVFVLMSGLITPVESMPAWAERITRLLPPRYFIETMRGIYLKGATIADLGSNYLVLSLFAVLFNTLAAITYRKQR